MKTQVWKLTPLVASLLIVGCASVHNTPPPSVSAPNTAPVTGSQNQQSSETAPTAANVTATTTPGNRSANQISSWNLKGSVSIQHQTGTDFATAQWDQQGSQYSIALYGPLSLGKVQITGHPGQVTLAQTGKSTASSTSPEQLMQKQLGWQLPISNLYYWVRGVPAPGKASRTRYDAANHLTQLVQQGWTISYTDYTTVQQVDLPKRIWLMGPNLRVSMVIKSWSI